MEELEAQVSSVTDEIAALKTSLTLIKTDLALIKQQVDELKRDQASDKKNGKITVALVIAGLIPAYVYTIVSIIALYK